MDEAAIEKTVDVVSNGVRWVGMIMIGVGSVLLYKGLTGK